MTFQPFVPTGGLAGWRFLQQTLDTQRAAFDRSPLVERDLDDFADRIGKVGSAAELVADFRLLSVALQAFGLSADLPNKHFIKTVLEEGTTEPDALANRLTDKRYRDLSRTFGFGDVSPPNTVLSDFSDRIAARFRDQAFEAALGQSDETMRLALFAKRELTAVSEGDGSDRTKWFTLMGTPPLRKVMEGALGLPTSFGALDLDRQLEVFRDRAADQFGINTFADFAEPGKMERVLDRFTATASGPGVGPGFSPALVLLRGF
jgi:hypothetical protein